MADKNIQMTQRNASNTGWDNLYPITKAENILLQTPWQPMVLESGWGQQSGQTKAMWRINEFDELQLKGVITGGSTAVSTITRFPSELLALTEAARVSVVYSSSTTYYSIALMLAADGRLYNSATLQGNNLMILDGISIPLK